MTLPDTGMWLALGIFLAEMCVVTVGTLRIIFIARNCRVLAPLLGFFEIVIWLFAIGQTMQNLDNILCCLAFALGFTAGNFLGMQIEKQLALGFVHVRVITHQDAGPLIQALQAANFRYTCVDGEGVMGPVRVVMSVVRRRQLSDLLHLIEAFRPDAFYAVDELQAASEGVYPTTASCIGLLPTMFHERPRSPESTPRPCKSDATGELVAFTQEEFQVTGDGDAKSHQAA